MTQTTQPNASAEAAQADRRRPARPDHVSPALLPLLRSGELPDADELVEFDEPDQASGARGLFAGLALAAPLWAAILSVGRWLLT